MITLGVDPDLHSTSWAILDHKSVLWVGRVVIPRRLRGAEAVAATIEKMRDRKLPPGLGIDRIAVEGQQIYQKGLNTFRALDQNDILMLAQVAGGMAALFWKMYPSAKLLLPKPAEWKGQVPKTVHHARIYVDLHLPYMMIGRGEQKAVVPEFEPDTYKEGDITPGTASHVNDAVGLALWAQSLAASAKLLESGAPATIRDES